MAHRAAGLVLNIGDCSYATHGPLQALSHTIANTTMSPPVWSV